MQNSFSLFCGCGFISFISSGKFRALLSSDNSYSFCFFLFFFGHQVDMCEFSSFLLIKVSFIFPISLSFCAAFWKISIFHSSEAFKLCLICSLTHPVSQYEYLVLTYMVFILKLLFSSFLTFVWYFKNTISCCLLILIISHFI